jgi:AraC-like DNA-binding protein
MQMNDDLEYEIIQPAETLADFVDSFWMLHNRSSVAKNVIGLPDGRIDLFFSRSESQPFAVLLLGIGTQPDQAMLPPQARMFAISFRLPAVEYILQTSVAGLVNKAGNLPDDFWGFDENALDDFGAFQKRASEIIQLLLPESIDERKRKLFELIYSSNGEMSVKELSEKSFWSSRQINRYFNQQFGVSLKLFCSILRFRASLEHIAQGRLFPELNFADQNHFIKEVKKFSGAIPKELFKNQNDRFILLSAIRQG